MMKIRAQQQHFIPQGCGLVLLRVTAAVAIVLIGWRMLTALLMVRLILAVQLYAAGDPEP